MKKITEAELLFVCLGCEGGWEEGWYAYVCHKGTITGIVRVWKVVGVMVMKKFLTKWKGEEIFLSYWEIKSDIFRLTLKPFFIEASFHMRRTFCTAVPQKIQFQLYRGGGKATVLPCKPFNCFKSCNFSDKD